MPEFRCEWAAVPANLTPPRVSFVEATDAPTAEKILRDHIERTEGVRIVIRVTSTYTKPTGGRVL